MVMISIGLDEIYAHLRKMGDQAGPLADALADVASAVIAEEWKKSIEAHGLVKTGAMRDSVGVGEGMRTGTTVIREIYPRGKDARGVRNASKAFILHYGTSRIPPTHFVADAEQNAEQPATEALQAAFSEYMETGVLPKAPAASGNAGGVVKKSTR